MSEVRPELEIAFQDAPQTQLFTLSAARWLEYIGELDSKVQLDYQRNDYYDVKIRHRDRPLTVRHKKHLEHFTIRAVMYRAVPVVIRSEYERAIGDMDGKELKWRVVHL